jgi:hypothetical protein
MGALSEMKKQMPKNVTEAQMKSDTSQQVADHHMRPDLVSSKPKRVLIVVANPTTATTVGWPVGFWGAELTHPCSPSAASR